jgi:hypothetical protein
MSRKSRYSTEFKQDAVSRMGQGGKTVPPSSWLFRRGLLSSSAHVRFAGCG